MSSDLYQSFGNNNQNPKEAAMSRLKQLGISVPEGMENNPQALINHVMQSGKVPQNRLSMAQQLMQKMFRR
jgi:hypothetical protein